MTWIELGNPNPLSEPKLYTPYAWLDSKVEYLPIPNSLPSVSIAEVLNSRRTIRKFKAVTPSSLNTLLWLTSREKAWRASQLGFHISQRPLPSAGAIHPIHILTADVNQNRWKRYIPQLHAMAEVKEGNGLNEVRNVVGGIIPPEEATLFLFVAEYGKTFSKYESATSLVWRDAGVILGALSLCSEALSLSFCPLGINGEPWANSLDKEGRLVGVGMALLGSV